MKTRDITQVQSTQNFSIMRYVGISQLHTRTFGFIFITIIITNLLSHTFFNPSIFGKPAKEPLYLIDKASMFVPDAPSFEAKVRDVAARLGVQPEWLMAVMYSESRFDAAALNLKGSGAVGLIQFMPATAGDMRTNAEKLRNMDHIQQLEYVYQYLDMVRQKYGSFENLTELYLAILFPKALEGDYCYSLYEKPSQAYKQNAGLDEDKNGRVTVGDIDKRMQRVFPKAYIAGKHKKGVEEEATSGYVNIAGF